MKAKFEYPELGYHKCPCVVNNARLPFGSCRKKVLMQKLYHLDSDSRFSPINISSHPGVLWLTRNSPGVFLHHVMCFFLITLCQIPLLHNQPGVGNVFLGDSLPQYGFSACSSVHYIICSE